MCLPWLDLSTDLSATLLLFQYLRNILYEYMLGKETRTLSKVICSVVRFSKEQTRHIEEREELRNSVSADWSSLEAYPVCSAVFRSP